MHATSMRVALSRASWDIVISDSCMLQFSAGRALAILKESRLDIPFVIVGDRTERPSNEDRADCDAFVATRLGSLGEG
jgi:hypothetical protein